jgi:hypothetical protein
VQSSGFFACRFGAFDAEIAALEQGSIDPEEL